ncbi:MAG: hypothetical protein LBL21_01790 [Rickettsiales bacterium]|jgi:hypothetical protein|nr:hypothetical protein [Rickettsiales bacterium]
MKNIFLVFVMICTSGVLFANCPLGFEPIEDDDYKVVKDDAPCPEGYYQIEHPDYLPFTAICDADKGACDDSVMCEYQP